MAAAAESDRKSSIREYYEALLIAIIFVNFARIFAFQAFKIPTGSMEDNLLTGDHILVNKFIYGPQMPVLNGLVPLREPRRGDVVVFRYPEQPQVDFVKRVVALPGETVLIRDKRVLIDGKELPEPYVLFTDERTQHPSSPFHRDHFGPYKVGAGEYFVMGDNRDNSHDSRFWGTVPRAMIKGRAFVVYWSFRLKGQPAGRLDELRMVLTDFFSNTRWGRTFFVVDREYHYGK
ncbi:MAG TPA: signal peptidase I [Thermoanaerobaculia bacterium]